jgi:hypothetical protein
MTEYEKQKKEDTKIPVANTTRKTTPSQTKNILKFPNPNPTRN